MSEHSSPEERTEMPTARRLQELRRHGQLHSSTEVVQTASLIAGFFILTLTWNWIYQDMKWCLIASFKAIKNASSLTQHDIYKGMIKILTVFLPDILIITLTVALVASLALMFQTKWNIKEKKIDFKFDFINPIAGIKRMFSIHSFTNVMKALAKLGLILPIGYFGLKKHAPVMVKLIHYDIHSIMEYLAIAAMDIFWKIAYVLIFLSVIDFFWTKHLWLKQNKMTKNEVKDERKSIEGDEETKKKIQQKGFLRILERIKDAVAKADVVVTNPTHYAVALKYDRETMSAPIVVAKGQGFLALRIKEIAKEHKVPVVERKSLARALYASVEVGTQIPRELFRVAAEVIAYVYRIKNASPYWRSKKSGS